MDIHIRSSTNYNHIVWVNFAECYIMRLVALLFATMHKQTRSKEWFLW